MSPLEGLLFSFGVDVGVMSVTYKNRVEVERLSQLLKEAQCQVEDLKKELGRRGGCMPGEHERAQKVQAPVLVSRLELYKSHYECLSGKSGKMVAWKRTTHKMLAWVLSFLEED
jgi:hypothetical protein